MNRFIMALILGWSFNCAAEFTIGLVDLQQAILQTSDGQRARKTLEGEFKKRSETLQKMESRMAKMAEEFERKAISLSRDAKERQQRELQMEIRKFQDSVAQNQKEMEKLQHELLDPIATKINSIVSDIGKKDGFAIVLNRGEQTVLYAMKEIDITEKVIRTYDRNRDRS